MRFTTYAGLLLALACSMAPLAIADAELIPSADGLTVHDTALHVTWLANANLPVLMAH